MPAARTETKISFSRAKRTHVIVGPAHRAMSAGRFTMPFHTLRASSYPLSAGRRGATKATDELGDGRWRQTVLPAGYRRKLQIIHALPPRQLVTS